MTKKNGVAMVMATALTSTIAVPISASNIQNSEKNLLIKEVEEKLSVKYSNPKETGTIGETIGLGEEYKNSVYKIKATVGSSIQDIDVKSVNHLENLIEKAEVNKEKVQITITDKGHKKLSDGKIVASFKGVKYTKSSLNNQFATSVNSIDTLKINENPIANINLDIDSYDLNNDIKHVNLEFINNETIKTLDKNSNKLDLNKPINIDGEEIIVDNLNLDTVVGFKEIVPIEKYGQDSLNATFAKYITMNETKELINAKRVKIADVKKIEDGNYYEIKLAGDLYSEKKITLKEGNTKLDLNTGIDSNGNPVKISEISNINDAKKIVGFAFADGTEDIDIESQKISTLTYNPNIEKIVEYDLSNLITETGFTEDAKELTRILKLADGQNPDKVITVDDDENVYSLKFSREDNLKIESFNDKSGEFSGYKLTIKLTISKSGNKLPLSPNVELVIKSKIQADLEPLKKAIYDGTQVSSAKFNKLAGNTRFETAVEISKESYVDSAKSVVLVGENAVVDGLASAPLSKKEKAPILLTTKDSIPTSTMNEIKRLIDKGEKIYLIGGENTISKKVELQLAKELNANIIRLSGENRYLTSLEIAKELNNAPKKAFVVGGNGLADAMSIASVAAQMESPIIVSPKEALTKEAKEFLDTFGGESIKSVDVVGGENNVSTQVLKDIINIENTVNLKVKRIAGENRNETNAKVIENKEYYPDQFSIDSVYVAKQENLELIDALAAAPLAGKTKKGVIILATNDLTKEQQEALESKTLDSAKEKVTQIGNGISLTVMQKILKAVGL